MGSAAVTGKSVLVCGGRHYEDFEQVCAILDGIHAETPIGCIIEGGAYGADRLAARWACLRRIPNKRFSADWAKYGRAAGPRRNQQMIDEGKPDLVVAFPGGTGTADMMARAKAAEIMVVEIE